MMCCFCFISRTCRITVYLLYEEDRKANHLLPIQTGRSPESRDLVLKKKQPELPNQHPKPHGDPGTSNTPAFHLINEEALIHYKRGGRIFKNTFISMHRQGPRSQHDCIIEALSFSLLCPFTCTSPPISKIQLALAGRYRTQTDRFKQFKPQLAGKYTRGENVLHCLQFLVTKKALFWMWKASLRQFAIQHLFRIASRRNILHLDGAQDFQSLFRGSKVVDPQKKVLYVDFDEKEPEAQ